MEISTSLLSSNSAATSELVVMSPNKKIVSPYLTTLVVQNAGDLDVSSEHFDQGRPIVFNLRVPIIKVVNASGRESSAPRYNAEGSSIIIGPDLIRRGTAIKLEVLTDGRPEMVSSDPLIDTSLIVANGLIQRRAKTSIRRNRVLKFIHDWRLAAIPFAGGIAFLAWSLFTSGPTQVPTLNTWPQIAQPGSVVRVAGSGYTVRQDTQISINCNSYDLYKVVQTDTTGSFSASFQLPAHDRDTPDNCMVEASQHNSSLDNAEGTLTVTSNGSTASTGQR
jgi:hypothetical protein